MWLKGLDISSDFLGYTVSGDSQFAEEDGFNSATREVGEGSGVARIGVKQALWSGAAAHSGGLRGEARAE